MDSFEKNLLAEISDLYSVPEGAYNICNNGKLEAIPSLAGNDIDAALIHETAIGKIAGEQLIKRMTLGLSEKGAEEQIINGFLK